jgi:hypothetical protein
MRRLLVMMVLLVAGCGADSGGSDSSEAAEPTTSSRCRPASAALVGTVSEGLLQQDPPLTLSNMHVVKSDDFESVYFVSGMLRGQGLDGEVATFATNADDGSGLTFAVDGIAQEFSDWGHGDTTDANMTMADDGARESADCAAA